MPLVERHLPPHELSRSFYRVMSALSTAAIGILAAVFVWASRPVCLRLILLRAKKHPSGAVAQHRLVLFSVQQRSGVGFMLESTRSLYHAWIVVPAQDMHQLGGKFLPGGAVSGVAGHIHT